MAEKAQLFLTEFSLINTQGMMETQNNCIKNSWRQASSVKISGQT
jgi:hypothetical protein